MNVQIMPTAADATRAAAERLATRLVAPGTRNVILAGGNTPLGLYAELGRRKLPLSHLTVFALDNTLAFQRRSPVIAPTYFAALPSSL